LLSYFTHATVDTFHKMKTQKFWTSIYLLCITLWSIISSTNKPQP